jgi:hypothetical protein
MEDVWFLVDRDIEFDKLYEPNILPSKQCYENLVIGFVDVLEMCDKTHLVPPGGSEIDLSPYQSLKEWQIWN